MGVIVISFFFFMDMGAKIINKLREIGMVKFPTCPYFLRNEEKYFKNNIVHF